MKKLFSICFSLFFAVSLFGHCPKTFFKASFVSYDAETRSMTVKQGEKNRIVRIHKKTKFFEMKDITDIKKGNFILITGCNCQDDWADRIAFAKDNKK